MYGCKLSLAPRMRFALRLFRTFRPVHGIAHDGSAVSWL